jgi:hypothetical protein
LELVTAASAPATEAVEDSSIRLDRLRGRAADAAAALQTEVDDYIARFADCRDEAGRRLVVRNGLAQPR